MMFYHIEASLKAPHKNWLIQLLRKQVQQEQSAPEITPPEAAEEMEDELAQARPDDDDAASLEDGNKQEAVEQEAEPAEAPQAEEEYIGQGLWPLQHTAALNTNQGGLQVVKTSPFLPTFDAHERCILIAGAPDESSERFLICSMNPLAWPARLPKQAERSKAEQLVHPHGLWQTDYEAC